MSATALPPIAQTKDASESGSSAPAARDAGRAGSYLAWAAAALVVSFAAVWIYVASAPMAFLSRDYPLWIAKRQLIEACRPDAVAIFGDSRTLAGFVPAAMPVPATNLALSGTSPIETYFAVKRLLACPHPPRLVVIGHGPLKFMSDSDFFNFDARTGFLGAADMRAVIAQAKRLSDPQLAAIVPPGQGPPWLLAVLYAARFPPLYFGSLIDSLVVGRLWHNRAVLRDALRSDGHALFGTAPGSSRVASEGGMTGFTAAPLIDWYFSQTIELLARRGVRTVFVGMPINASTYARTSAAARDGFSRYLRQTALQHPSLVVAGSGWACWPDRLFGDAWHMNAEGAAQFTTVVGAWLQAPDPATVPPALSGLCGSGAGGPSGERSSSEIVSSVQSPERVTSRTSAGE